MQKSTEEENVEYLHPVAQPERHVIVKTKTVSADVLAAARSRVEGRMTVGGSLIVEETRIQEQLNEVQDELAEIDEMTGPDMFRATLAQEESLRAELQAVREMIAAPTVAKSMSAPARKRAESMFVVEQRPSRPQAAKPQEEVWRQKTESMLDSLVGWLRSKFTPAPKRESAKSYDVEAPARREAAMASKAEQNIEFQRRAQTERALQSDERYQRLQRLLAQNPPEMYRRRYEDEMKSIREGYMKPEVRDESAVA